MPLSVSRGSKSNTKSRRFTSYSEESFRPFSGRWVWLSESIESEDVKDNHARTNAPARGSLTWNAELQRANTRAYLKHLAHDGLHCGHKHLLLGGERPENVIVLVGTVQLLVGHPYAVVGGLRVDHVKVARRLLPVCTRRDQPRTSSVGEGNNGCCGGSAASFVFMSLSSTH